MAVMNKCCCCGVRSGSIASAVYSLVLAIIGLACFGLSAAVVLNTEPSKNGGSLGGYLAAIYAFFIISCIMFVFMIIACIFVFIGVIKDNKGMLIPFMVAQGFHMLWYILIIAIYTALLALAGEILAFGFILLGIIIVLILLFTGNLVGLLCVISQYQEYRDGRGRALDQPGPSTTTSVVVQQHQAPADVVYTSNPPACAYMQKT